MVEFIFAIFPWVFVSLVFVLWMKYLGNKIKQPKALLILSAGIITVSQLCATSLLLGIFKQYTPIFVYTINAIIAFIVHVLTPRLETNDFYYWSWLKKKDPFTKGVISLSIVLLLWKIVLGVVMNDVSFDAMNYHLSWVGYAVQEEHFGPFETPVPWINSYPKTLTLWYGWFLLPPANDFLVDLAQIPIFLLGVVAVYHLLRFFNYDEDTSIISSLLLLFFPVVYLQLTTNYIDVALASLVFVLFTFAIQKKQSFLSLVLFALTAGLLIGGKSTMVIPIFFAFLLLCYRLYNQKNLSVIDFFIRLVCIGIIIFLLGGYWYIRNLLYYGDLLYPVKVMVGNFTLVPGVVTAAELIAQSKPDVLDGVSSVKSLFINTFQTTKPRYDMVPGGFGVIWSYFLFFLQPIAITILIKRKLWTQLVFLFFFWIIWFISPGNWWFRYVIVVGVTGLLSFAIVYSRSSILGKRLIAVYVSILSLYSASMMIWPYYTDIHIFGEKVRSGILNADFSYRYGSVYEDIQNVAREQATIAYDSSWFTIYPLWNQTRSNRVVYIPYQDLWLEKLTEQQVEYLTVKSDSPEFTYIQSRPDLFSLVSSSHIYNLYKLENK